MGMVPPPSPLGLQEYRDRVAFLRSKHPGRAEFSIAELDPALAVWLRAQKLFHFFGAVVFIVSLSAALAIMTS